MPFVGAKERAARVEVTVSQRKGRGWVLGLAGGETALCGRDVREEVPRPAEQLLED